MEAHEAACVGCLLFAGYVAGEVMGKGENGTREGADTHHFQAPALQATLWASVTSLQTSCDKIRCYIDWSDLEQDSEQHL